ncbi:hypothetical protein TWF696_008052 [Orbilia brochopaga]|uniref:CFEM domain-containing protein n=1 Tax=Orbilia brochopaga TaxID=3140254 RepID=A0AAV9UPD7_9PEZI
MKGTVQFFSVLAAMKAVSASDSYDWFSNGQNKFNPVAYSSDSCTPKQQTGYDFSDAPQGDLPNYDDFNLSGYKCSKSKLQRRSGGGQGSNCASSKVEPTNYGNEIKCGKTFSVNEFHVSVEIPSTLEFTYGMPDGSSCKQVSHCGSGITAIQNTQCGGAKSVKCRLHNSSQNQKPCSFNIHHIKFHCDSGSKSSSTTRASTTSAACYGPNCGNGNNCYGPNCAGSSTTTLATTTSAACYGENCGNGAGSSSTTAATTSTTAGACYGENCGNGAGSSSTTASTTAATTAATTATVCYGADCGNGNGEGSSSSTTTTTVCNGEGCGNGAGSSSTTAATTTTSPICGYNGYNCDNGNGNGPATTTTTAAAQTTTGGACYGENCGNGAGSSSTIAATTAATTGPCYGEDCGNGNGSGSSTTAATTGPCYGENCGNGNGSGSSTTAATTSPACYGENCNGGATPTTTPAAGYVCTDYTCTAGRSSPSSTKPAGIPDYGAPSDVPYAPPKNGSTPYLPPSGSETVPATTPYSPVPVVTNCPNVLPKCMETWTKITKCINSGDVECLCPNADYINNVAQCVEAWSSDDSEVIKALQYMRGLCAQYIPGNPAIVTAVPSYVTVPPVTSYGATTIVVSTVVTVPYTNGPAPTATGYGNPAPVYTTQVIATTVTVCPVKLVTTESAKPVLVPGTVSAPPYVPAPTVPATVPAPYPTGPAYVPTTMATAYPTAPAPPAYNGTTPNPPVATGAASSIKALSSLALAGVISILALIMA